MRVPRKPKKRWWLRVGPFSLSCYTGLSPLPPGPGALAQPVGGSFPRKRRVGGVLPEGGAVKDKLP